MPRLTLNDDDRAQWIDNDESLYDWWRASRQTKRAFIRENRDEITRYIRSVLDQEPACKAWYDYVS